MEYHYRRRKKSHQHRGRRVLPLLFCAMLLTAGCLTAQKMLPDLSESLLVIRDKDAERIYLPIESTKTGETDTTEDARDNVWETANTPVETMIPVTTETETAETEPGQELEPIHIGLRQRIPTDYDYASPVPENEPVTIDYMNDAVLIGDSRMQGLILYCGLSRITSYTYKGLTVDSVFTKPVIEWTEPEDAEEKIPDELWSDGKVPVMSALSQTKFSKVYIMLGINETGWPDADDFTRTYGKVLDAIREYNPDCLIYMLSVFPVTKAVSDTHDYVTNEKIALYNTCLQELAYEKEVFLIDLAPAVVDENGVLPADSGVDGIHLNKVYCIKVLDHILAHTVPLRDEAEVQAELAQNSSTTNE